MNRGLTLIESIIWIVVGTLLFAGIVYGIINIYKSNSYTFERALAIASARRGLEATTTLIREAGYSDAGAYPVVAFDDNSFTFYADYDNDDSFEQIQLFLSGDDLQRGVIEPSGIPAEYTGAQTTSTIVRNMRNTDLGVDLFTYYDSDGVAVTDASALLEPVFVRVDVVTNTGKNPYVNDYALRGSAFMRNLKN